MLCSLPQTAYPTSDRSQGYWSVCEATLHYIDYVWSSFPAQYICYEVSIPSHDTDYFRPFIPTYFIGYLGAFMPAP